MIVTCEFDPLRDEGRAYAAALARAGAPVQELHVPGSHPRVADDGRCGDFRRAGASKHGRGAAQVLLAGPAEAECSSGLNCLS